MAGGGKHFYQEGLDVFFRALSQKDNKTWKEGDDLIPLSGDPAKKGITYKRDDLESHLKKIADSNKPNDYFISMAKGYVAAFLKYAHGLNRLTKEGEKNSTRRERSRVVLVFDENKILKMPDEDIQLEDFIDCENKEYFNNTFVRGYVPADREVDVFGKVEGKQVREVHPLLGDMMMLFDSYSKSGDSEEKNEIINKVIDGNLSFQIVDDFVEQLKKSNKYNEIEKIFLKKYYQDRMYVDDIVDDLIADGLLPEKLPEIGLGNINTEDRNKTVFGNCIRNTLANKVLLDFKNIYFKDYILNENTYRLLPQEIDYGTTATEGGEQVGACRIKAKEDYKDAAIPVGMRYLTQGEKVIACSADVRDPHNAIRRENYTMIEAPDKYVEEFLDNFDPSTQSLDDCMAAKEIMLEYFNNNPKSQHYIEEEDKWLAIDEKGRLARVEKRKINDFTERCTEILGYIMTPDNKPARYLNGQLIDDKGFNMNSGFPGELLDKIQKDIVKIRNDAYDKWEKEIQEKGEENAPKSYDENLQYDLSINLVDALPGSEEEKKKQLIEIARFSVKSLLKASDNLESDGGDMEDKKELGKEFLSEMSRKMFPVATGNNKPKKSSSLLPSKRIACEKAFDSMVDACKGLDIDLRAIFDEEMVKYEPEIAECAKKYLDEKVGMGDIE